MRGLGFPFAGGKEGNEGFYLRGHPFLYVSGVWPRLRRASQRKASADDGAQVVGYTASIENLIEQQARSILQPFSRSSLAR
jgi:hypothetical protein